MDIYRTARASNPAPTGQVLDRRYPVVMLATAAAVWTASYLHLGGRIQLGLTTFTGEHFGLVSGPEAVIGGLLAAGAVVITVTPHRGRTVARRVTGLAVLGVLAGLAVSLARSPHIAADLTYHLSLLTVLLATFLSLTRPSTTP